MGTTQQAFVLWIISLVFFLRESETASNNNLGPHFHDHHSPFLSDRDRYGTSFSPRERWERYPEQRGGRAHRDEFPAERRRRLEASRNTPPRPPWISAGPYQTHRESGADRWTRGEVSGDRNMERWQREEAQHHSEYLAPGRSRTFDTQERSMHALRDGARRGKRERLEEDYSQQQGRDADRRMAGGARDRWRGDRSLLEREDEHVQAAGRLHGCRTWLWEASPPPPEEPLWDRILNGTFDSFWSSDRAGQRVAEDGARSTVRSKRREERERWREQRKREAAKERMCRNRGGVAVEEVEEDEEEEEDWVKGNATEMFRRGRGGDEPLIREMIREAMPRLCPDYDVEQLAAWKEERGAKVHIHKPYTDPGAGRTLKTGRGRTAVLTDQQRLRVMRSAAIERLSWQEKERAASEQQQRRSGRRGSEHEAGRGFRRRL